MLSAILKACYKQIILLHLLCLSTSNSSTVEVFEWIATSIIGMREFPYLNLIAENNYHKFHPNLTNQYSQRQCPKCKTEDSKTRNDGQPTSSTGASATPSKDTKYGGSGGGNYKFIKPKEGKGGGNVDKKDEQDSGNKFSCKNSEGNSVDWFIAIKKDNDNRFVYVTNEADAAWMNEKDITAEKSPVTQTLYQLTFCELLRTQRCTSDRYNNQPPDDDEFDDDAYHMKGVILFGNREDDTGFWMTHSVPRFPSNKGNDFWSKVKPDDKNRGQSFFCATFKKKDMLDIYNMILQLTNRNLIAFSTYYSTHPATAVKYFENIIIFSKRAHDNEGSDIYERIESNKVRVQTYRLGTSPPLPNTDKVENVVGTKFNGDFGYMFFARDNSKWAIGEATENFVCIGDLDRVEDHKITEGTLQCMKNAGVWRLFNAAIINGAEAALHEDRRSKIEDQSQQGAYARSSSSNEFTCKITKGTVVHEVDWFVMVKFYNNENKESNGLEYQYLSSENNDWERGKNIGDHGPLKETLSQTFKNKGHFMAYNDAPSTNVDPNQSDLFDPDLLKLVWLKQAHAKGVVMLGSKKGFWLMHSVPQFPDFSKEEYYFPVNGVKNGQIIFCLTFDVESEKKNIISQIEKMFSKTNYRYQQMRSTALSSNNGMQFVHISRCSNSNNYNQDIYEIVRSLLSRNLYCQTWRTGSGTNMTSTTIDQVYVKKYPGWISMRESNDHSKWCITQDESLPYFCVGDLNRELPDSRNMRGGGVLCLRDKNVWQKFRESLLKVKRVLDVEPYVPVEQ